MAYVSELQRHFESWLADAVVSGAMLFRGATFYRSVTGRLKEQALA